MMQRLYRWFDRNFLELGREMRLSYLPPLMVYMAAGVSGLTSLVGTFFVKEYLGLSAAFLAALGFWAGIPWALKMPIGHLVDLLWRWKAGLVYLGASLIATSIGIMIGLIGSPDTMREVMSAEHWFVLAALLSPIGYVMQDAVADAMTVEAVPRFEADGSPVPDDTRRLMNTTMQTLGRVAIIGGSVLVSLVNVVMFAGTEALPQADKVAIYVDIYQMALVIPALSVAGVMWAGWLRRSKRRQLVRSGADAPTLRAFDNPGGETLAHPNWWILGGSLVFVVITVGVGLSGIDHGQEIIFVGSFAVIGFLMTRLLRELDAPARNTLLGTAIV
ncbi:MAG: hypothetical protein KDH20_08575, partial [Rhodocyclaceae bacterium]|nr:hypothetical protein [Rhodocyclaceae bacterium]